MNNKDELYRLTERELEVLKQCSLGHTNPEIAEDLMISRHTVKAHMCSIFKKLEVDSRTQAVLVAERSGLLDW